MEDPFLPRMAERLSKENHPQTIIVESADLIDQLHRRIGNEKLPKKDLNEILTQVVCVLLNHDVEAGEQLDEKLLELPDFNRMTSAAMFSSLKPATTELATALRARLAEYGIYNNEEFPYFFDSLLDRDIVLTHLPY